jgi:hypothetical protein
MKRHNEVGHKGQRARWRARRWRERPSYDMTSASKGHRRQVSTSIACLYNYCAESATKTNTLIDSYTATGREVRASFASDLFKLHPSCGNLIFSIRYHIRYHIRATGALHGPGGISPPQPVFRTSTPLVPLVLAHLLLARLSQPVFRLSAPPWPLALAHSPLTQHFSASDHFFSCPWVLSVLAYNRRVQAVFC